MAKVDPKLRERMMKQKEGMKREGVIVEKKRWRRGVVRLLPVGVREPGVEFSNYYCKELKKGTTAPRSFDASDPLWDYLETVFRTGSKDEKDHAKDYLNRSTQYWVAVVVRGDEGTPDTPNVKVFPFTGTIYEKIMDWMTDEDIGEDITHPDEGRDILVKKEGEGKDTEWKAERMSEASWLHDEDPMYEALKDIATRFNPKDHFYQFDLEVYEQMYEGLTGHSLPSEVRDELKALEKGEHEGASSRPTEDYEDDTEPEGGEEGAEEGAVAYEDDTEEGGEDGAEEGAEEGGDEWEPPEGVEFGVTRVSFIGDDDAELTGVVMGWEGEETENLEVVEEGGDADNPYLMALEDMTILEDEEPPEEEATEPTEPEAEPTVQRRKAKASSKKKAKASSKKKTSKKVTKATPRKPGEPARKKVVTRSAKASKKATKKKAKASSKIRSRAKR